jgi:hypothetical protein
VRLMFVGLFLALGLLACSAPPPRPASTVDVGRETDFARGSVTALELATTFSDPDPPAIGSATPGVITRLPRMDISPVPIFLVRDDAGPFTALYARDPFRGCRVEWIPAGQRFEDPCFGNKYSKAGEWLEGPSPRGLDQFGVSVTAADDVVVDIAKYQPGHPHP